MTVLDLAFDGHTHTSWCPHAARDPLSAYLDRARAVGLRRYAVTEHIPLPRGFVDPLGPLECANDPDTLVPYLDEAEALREQHAGHLEVLIGLEIDYLGAAQGGWHGALLELLGPVWPRLDHEATLLSVHFLADSVVDGTVALTRRDLVPNGAANDAYHMLYYDALKSAIQASWTWHGIDLRPRRVGHLTLPRKFIKALPLSDPERVLDAATEVLELIAREGLELDLNTAGLDKPDCGELYLPEPLLSRAVRLGVPLVLGSDAHQASEVARHRQAATAAVLGAGGRISG